MDGMSIFWIQPGPGSCGSYIIPTFRHPPKKEFTCIFVLFTSEPTKFTLQLCSSVTLEIFVPRKPADFALELMVFRSPVAFTLELLPVPQQTCRVYPEAVTCSSATQRSLPWSCFLFLRNSAEFTLELLPVPKPPCRGYPEAVTCSSATLRSLPWSSWFSETCSSRSVYKMKDENNWI